ncbi:MAG: tyrosine-type recombinase/integrase [Candidatus Latescibacteria bacterium]|nr:tyrosine-type recombinase/integrase [Candidatus Latescibacterota bacterium]
MKQPQSDIRPMTPVQIRQVIGYFDGDTFLGLRNQTIVRLMFTMGLRVGEVSRLRVTDIDLGDRAMFIQGKGDKNIWVPIPKKTGKHLWHYMIQRELRKNAMVDNLFLGRAGRWLSPDAIKHIFQGPARHFKFPGIRMSPHTLRHSYAVAFLELGGGNVFELQQLLRHNDLEMTRRYVMLAKSHLRDAVDRSSPDGLV